MIFTILATDSVVKKNSYLSLFSRLFFSTFKVVNPESASSASNKNNDSVIRYYIPLGGM
jgi:hypothetical protein